MRSEIVDRDLLRALRAVRATFGPGVQVLAVERHDPDPAGRDRDASSPRNPRRRADQGRLWAG